jgi:exosortase 1
MPRDTGAIMGSVIGADKEISPPWRSALIHLTITWGALIAIFASDWAAMVRQWWDISTYNHILLIVPILGWLAYQRWPELHKLTPCAWWPALVPFCGAALLWMLGAVSGLDVARQAGAVGMLICAVPAVLGVRVAAGLAFPLCYMVFLVPIGEELVKPLQMVTADITIALTHASGVPAEVDGVFINTPAGLFEVAEACSGVKFLIAMLAFGVLAANVCFISWRRRAIMVVACLIVPVAANGIRAWGTIYAAQIFGIEAAAGFDHIVYGWVFFAVVLTIVILCAWRWFDRPVTAPMIDAEALQKSALLTRLQGFSGVSMGKVLMMLASVVGLIRLWAFAAAAIAAPMPSAIDLPQVPGWTRVNYAPTIWWEPRAGGADHRLLGRYRDSRGREVDVFVALYAAQDEGREAGGFGQGALVPDSTWSWQAPGPPFGSGKSERLLGSGRIERLAVTWYRNGDMLSGSNLKLKLAVIGNHLLVDDDATSTLILSAEDSGKGSSEDAIQAFMVAIGPLGPWMDHITKVR